jgi:hypothetical protein
VNNGVVQVKTEWPYCYCMTRTGRRWVGLLPSETGPASARSLASIWRESLVMQAYPPPIALKSQTDHLTHPHFHVQYYKALLLCNPAHTHSHTTTQRTAHAALPFLHPHEDQAFDPGYLQEKIPWRKRHNGCS